MNVQEQQQQQTLDEGERETRTKACAFTRVPRYNDRRPTAAADYVSVTLMLHLAYRYLGVLSPCDKVCLNMRLS